MLNQIDRNRNRNCKQSQIYEILPFVRERPLRQDLLQFARRH